MIVLYLQSLYVAILASVVALGFALVSQYGFDLHPCVLCIYQRWPYVAIIAIAILGLFLAKRYGKRHWYDLLCALGFATTSGIGMFHVGVEQGWWQGLDGCVADTSSVSSLNDLKAQIMSAPLVKCDDIPWELFGISMAGYNALLALIMTLFMLRAFMHNRP